MNGNAMESKRYDLISVGRVSMDLFAQQIGSPFEAVKGFDASVGGSPVNIAIGTARLGLRSAALTAVGEDMVGDFVLRYLKDAGVETAFVHRKPDTRTGVAILAVQPPDKFPLVFYRDNPADIQLTIDDACQLPFALTRAFMISGTALSRGTCRDAVLWIAETCRRHRVTTFMDLDLRPDQWSNPLAFGANTRAILSALEVIIGTEEEFYALLAADPANVMRGESITAAQQAELLQLMEHLFAHHPGIKALVLKRGARGVSVLRPGEAPFSVEGYPVEVLNTVGAGDAFASGLIYAYLQDWDWKRCLKMGNACGAITVTRHGCSAVLPTLEETMAFIDERDGF